MSRPSGLVSPYEFFEVLVLAVVVIGGKLRGQSLQILFGQRWISASQVFPDLALGVSLLLVSTAVVAILGGHQRGASPDQTIA